MKQLFLILFLCVLAVDVMAVPVTNTVTSSPFNAVADAITIYGNTTSNSVIIVTTNVVSSLYLGAAVEAFGCGPVTVAPDCQDAIGIITNIINGTNLYINVVAQRTLTNTFIACGHDNEASFNAAYAATIVNGGPDNQLNIPAGKYLVLCTNFANGYHQAIGLGGGGIHIVGAGMTNTVLIGQGAWRFKGGTAVSRGYLFVITTPATNDFPISFENLTLDGGVPQGNTSDQGFPANIITGSGWDVTHGAIVVLGTGSGVGNTITKQTWTNVLFTHWRGEMVKSTDGSTNGNLTVSGCVFADGNASAINYYTSLAVTNCIFTNLFFVMEYYQATSTNTSYFRNSIITNTTHGGLVLNGATGINPPFIIQSNLFYTAPNNGAILTEPSCNLSAIGNTFYNSQGSVMFYLGATGGQGTFCNSNILIYGNCATNSSPCTFVLVWGADEERTRTLTIVSNTVLNCGFAYQASGDASNTVFRYNNLGTSKFWSGVAFNGDHRGNYLSVETNNIYQDPGLDEDHGIYFNSPTLTNIVSYGINTGTGITGGPLHTTTSIPNNTIIQLEDSFPSQIPAGAYIKFDNSLGANHFIVYPSSSPIASVPVVAGQVINFYWNGAAWNTNGFVPVLIATMPFMFRN